MKLNTISYIEIKTARHNRTVFVVNKQSIEEADNQIRIIFKGNYTGSKTLYFTITPKKVSLSSVKSTAKKKATVKWSKQSGVTGYEILLATNSKFSKGKKVVTVKGASAKSKTVTKLKSKKTYYVKVRSYKTIDGKKVYGSYSKVKKVKVK